MNKKKRYINILTIVTIVFVSIFTFVYIYAENIGTKNIINVKKIVVENSIESKELSEEKILELYKLGYGFQDIEKAILYAKLSEKTVEQILQMRGKTIEHIKFSKETGGTNQNKDYNMKSWEDIAQLLKIDLTPAEIRLGISTEKIEKLNKQGFSYNQIIECVMLSKRFNKSEEEILNKMKQGYEYEQLVNEYKGVSNNGYMNNKSNIELKNKAENLVIKKYNITAADINKYKSYGFGVVQIGYAKELANKYNKKYNEILEMMKLEKDWQKVIKQLGEGE